MTLETRVILVLFHKVLSTVTIEKLLDGFGPSFLQRAQVFQENHALYAVQVLTSTADEWESVLAQLPEVILTMRLGSLRFENDRIM